MKFSQFSRFFQNSIVFRLKFGQIFSDFNEFNEFWQMLANSDELWRKVRQKFVKSSSKVRQKFVLPILASAFPSSSHGARPNGNNFKTLQKACYLASACSEIPLGGPRPILYMKRKSAEAACQNAADLWISDFASKPAPNKRKVCPKTKEKNLQKKRWKDHYGWDGCGGWAKM